MTPSPDDARNRPQPADGEGTNYDPDATDYSSAGGHGPNWGPAGPADYEVLEEIARGGMGVVYKARQRGLNRLVALKVVLSGGHAGCDDLARFRAEAEAIARLQHPNIVQIHEVGEHDGRPFFSLEFCPGGSLDKRLNGTPLATAEAAALVETLARAMHAAHTAGVVHRDLKPANVLLAADGAPKVTDFGLAKRLDADSGQTKSGAVMGTPSYMAPEQAGGKSREVGTHTDVYALGAVLYECLTGRPPFKGASNWETVQQVIEQDPLPPSRLVPKLPRDLETITLKCLQKEPPKRYASAAALEEDLRRYREGRPIRARPVGLVGRAWKWTKRRPTVAAVAAVAAVGLVVGGLAYQRQREQARAEGERQKHAERAAALVQNLAVTETAGVPSVVRELADRREWADPLLRQARDAAPERSKLWLHSRLALLPVEPGLAGELADYLLRCKPDEVVTLREALKPHAEAIAPALWAKATAAGQESRGERLRAACALAAYAPEDPRWGEIAPGLVEDLSEENLLEAAHWAEALEPVRRALVGPLAAFCRETRRAMVEPVSAAMFSIKTEYGTRPAVEGGDVDDLLTGYAAGRAKIDVAAILIARYATDHPGALAELIFQVDPKQYSLLLPRVRDHRESAAALMEAELGRSPGPDSGDAEREALAWRQARAAVALMHLGRPERVWPLFRHSPDPTLRSHLVHSAAALRVDPRLILRRAESEANLSALRGLVLALGEFTDEQLPPAARAPAADRFLALYRSHPDPGLHSALDWLLRRKWGKAAELAAADRELAAGGRKPSGASPGQPTWYVAGRGQTFVAIPGPVEFAMGSPQAEPGRAGELHELRHRRRIGRSFAIAAREVTVEEVLAWKKDFGPRRDLTPARDGPMIAVTWQEAVAYCNWLSDQEGIPKDQWCYVPDPGAIIPGTKMLAPDYLGRAGYRLPSEAEWEYAARAGAETAHHYGRGDALLRRYACGVINSGGRAWPCGFLKPNDLGLFDTLGNAMEWCSVGFEWYPVTASEATEDKESPKRLVNDNSRVLRGGSFYHPADQLRSATRGRLDPGQRSVVNGFRLARTLPADFFNALSRGP